jgi:hypothetical protein
LILLPFYRFEAECLGEMNNHKIEQHLQKGDIPSEEKK